MESIQRIVVSGIEYPVYSFDFNFGGSQGPSSVDVQFVSEDGQYRRIDLTTKVATVISLPGFKFTGYPVSSEVNRTTRGSLLKIKYYDTSIILDKYNIGLYKKHSQTKVSTIPYLIILGNEKDPCMDESGNSIRERLDPCNPCADKTTIVNNFIDCEKQRKLNLAEVVYTLEDVLNKLPVNYTNAPISNNEFYMNYTGTLRDVLQQICSDYGYTFYWDDGKINFINLREDIEINDSGIDASQIIATSESESIENSVSRSAMAYFGIPGEELPYTCERDYRQKIICHPLTLKDIIPSSAPIMTHYVNYDRLQGCCVMSKYSTALRDNYVWFIQKQIVNAEACEEMKDKGIRLLGNMIIRGVAHSKSLGSEQFFYSYLLSKSGSDAEKQDLISRGVYFFKAQFSEELHDKFLKMEKDLSDQFIGNYYMRMFDPIISRSTAHFQGADGNIQYYIRGISAAQFPFINVIPENIQYGNDLINKMVNQETANDNYIMVSRKGSWSPAENQSAQVSQLITENEKYQIRLIGQDNVGGWLTRPHEYIFMAFEMPKGFAVSSFQEVTNPEDQKFVNQRIDVGDKKTTLGLRSASCDRLSIRFPNCGTLNILMPANSGWRFGGPVYAAGRSITGVNGNHGYTVLYENSSSEYYKIIRNKIELTRYRMAQDDTLKYEINFRDVSDPVLNYLSTENSNICNFNKTKIAEAMDEYMKNMDYKKNTKSIKKQYTLCGFPTKTYTLSDGLQGYSVRVGDSGVETYLVFGNSYGVPINIDMTNKMFERLAGNLNQMKIPWKALIPKTASYITEI